MAFSCHHCNGSHDTVAEGRVCAKFEERRTAEANRAAAYNRVTPWQELDATANQVSFIADLSKKKGVPTVKPDNRAHASRLIAYLKAKPDVKNPEQPGFQLDFRMVNLIKSGRYAVRADDTSPYIFIRVLRPTTGKLRGMLKIDTQHSDQWIKRLVFSSSGALMYHRRGMHHGQSLSELLTLIMVNQAEGAWNYAELLGACGACGKTLTDERSRYYHVGPDCERKPIGQAILNHVTDIKGEYAPA